MGNTGRGVDKEPRINFFENIFLSYILYLLECETIKKIDKIPSHVSTPAPTLKKCTAYLFLGLAQSLEIFESQQDHYVRCHWWRLPKH